MVVVYSNEENGPKSAIANGLVPDKRKIEEILHSFMDVGAHDPLDGSSLEVVPSFLAVSEALNDTFAVISGAGIRHYLICPNLTFRIEQLPVRLETAPLRQQSQFDYLLSALTEPSSCLNLIVDSVAGDENRVRNYILIWKLATQFRLKRPEDYGDYDKYQLVCRDLLRTLNKNPDTSIIRYLSEMEDDSRYFCYKSHSDHYFPKQARSGNS